MKLFATGWAILLSLLFAGAIQAQTIPVVQLSTPPLLDAKDLEWGDHVGVRVKLFSILPEPQSSGVEAREVLMKVGRWGDEVLFYFEWQDSEPDQEWHKPYQWDEAQQRYRRGPEREDRLALQLAMDGDYTTRWLSGNEFRADMWHWKASRSNPLGLAHDKMTQVSRSKLLRSYRGQTPAGEPVYILRSSDQGSPLYSTRRYGRKLEQRMPKYVLQSYSRGSIADVAARGEWRDGRWHLEMRRLMNTGHGDDAVLIDGQTIKAGIAVFDRSENDDHKISDTLSVQF